METKAYCIARGGKAELRCVSVETGAELKARMRWNHHLHDRKRQRRERERQSWLSRQRVLPPFHEYKSATSIV